MWKFVSNNIVPNQVRVSAKTGEEDYTDSDTGTDEFQRVFRKDGHISTTKGQTKDKDGLIYRLSGKVSKRNAELQVENQRLQDENETLKLQLNFEKKKRLQQREEIISVIRDSNVQIGDGNTINVTHLDGDNEDPIPLLREILRRMTGAFDEIIHKQTVAESELKKFHNYLQKIQDVVIQLKQNSSTSEESEAMEKLKEMVEIATETSKSDVYRTIQNALETLKADDEMNKFDDLNSDVRHAIRIIIYIFGSMTQESFANLLGLSLNRQYSTGADFIDERSCAMIILHWLKKKPGQRVGDLIDILKGTETKSIQKSVENIKEQTFVKTAVQSGGKQHDKIEPGPLSHSSMNLISDSLSNLSRSSNLSVISETLEKLEKHATETLQNPDIKPDRDAILCAMYKLHMENTKTLYAIGNKIGWVDE